MPKPSDTTTHDGKQVDWLTHAALLTMEERLGYPLTVVQGHHVGTPQSAGTHDRWGVVDLAPWDWRNKCKVGREVGFTFWHRLPSQGNWGEHIHGNLISDRARMSPAAQRQVDQYRAGTNGLANHARDTFLPHPVVSFRWPGSVEALALEKRVRAKVYKQHTPPKPPSGGARRIDLADLSHFNTVTLQGLQQAAKSGLRGIYHKCTEGTTFLDKTYSVRRGLNARGPKLRWGAYHFAHPGENSGTKEARFFLAHAGVNPGNLPPMLDLEVAEGCTRAELTKYVREFAAEVKRQTGWVPVVYLAQSIDLDDTCGCELWVPRYSNSNKAPRINSPWKQRRVWQFSNGTYGNPHVVAGLGHVDLDEFRGGPVALAGWKVPEHRKPPPPPPPPPPPDDPTKPPAADFVTLACNVQYTDPLVDSRATVESCFKAKPDLIFWNEIESAGLVDALRAHSDDYEHFPALPAKGREPGPASYVTVSWRKATFAAAGKGTSHKASDGKAHVTPTRVVNEQPLELLAKRKVLTAVVTQAVAHVEVSGRLRKYTDSELPQFEDQPKRYRQDLTCLRDVLEAAKARGPAVWAADLNVSANAERAVPKAQRVPFFPLSMLGPVQQFDNTKYGTHGSRNIDQGGHTAGVKCVEVRRLAYTKSDHRRVRRSYTVAA